MDSLEKFRKNKIIQGIADFYSIQEHKIECLFAKIFDLEILSNNNLDNRPFSLLKRSIWPFLMQSSGTIKQISLIILEAKNGSFYLGSFVTSDPPNKKRIMFFPAINSFAQQDGKNLKKGFHITVDYSKELDNIHLTYPNNKHTSIIKNGFDENKSLFTIFYNKQDYEECYRHVLITKIGTKNSEKRFFEVLDNINLEIIKIPYPYDVGLYNIFIDFYFKRNIKDKSKTFYGIEKKEDINEKFRGIIDLSNQDFLATIFSLEQEEEFKSFLAFQNTDTYYLEREDNAK